MSPSPVMQRLYSSPLSNNPRIQIIRDKLTTGYEKILPYAYRAQTVLNTSSVVVGRFNTTKHPSCMKCIFFIHLRP